MHLEHGTSPVHLRFRALQLSQATIGNLVLCRRTHSGGDTSCDFLPLHMAPDWRGRCNIDIFLLLEHGCNGRGHGGGLDTMSGG